ncbi:putative ER biogenesis protein, partial [Reticulomyxa filosa]
MAYYFYFFLSKKINIQKKKKNKIQNFFFFWRKQKGVITISISKLTTLGEEEKNWNIVIGVLDNCDSKMDWSSGGIPEKKKCLMSMHPHQYRVSKRQEEMLETSSEKEGVHSGTTRRYKLLLLCCIMACVSTSFLLYHIVFEKEPMEIKSGRSPSIVLTSWSDVNKDTLESRVSKIDANANKNKNINMNMNLNMNMKQKQEPTIVKRNKTMKMILVSQEQMKDQEEKTKQLTQQLKKKEEKEEERKIDDRNEKNTTEKRLNETSAKGKKNVFMIYEERQRDREKQRTIGHSTIVTKYYFKHSFNPCITIL